MDPDFLAILLFCLIVLVMIGGFILIFPITRRLGRILEQRLNDRGVTSGASPDEVQRLEAAVLALRADLEQLVERQEFTESLLQERQPLQLPRK